MLIRKRVIIIANLVLILVMVGLNVVYKESLRKTGDPVLFKLRPVDPRSIMQGDYMELRYAITQDVSIGTIPSRGYIVFTCDKNAVAQRVRFQRNKTPLNGREGIIKYYCHKNDISIGSESFFFQEGQGHKYSIAKYGCLKIGKNGNSILTGLFKENFKKIIP